MVTNEERHQRSIAAARLIEEARERVLPSLSRRKAAAQAGVSEGRWRQLVRGYDRHGLEVDPAIGKDETLLAMAQVVGMESEVREILALPARALSFTERHPERGTAALAEDFEGAVARLRAAMNDPKATAEEKQAIQALLDAAAQTANMITDRRD